MKRAEEDKTGTRHRANQSRRLFVRMRPCVERVCVRACVRAALAETTKDSMVVSPPQRRSPWILPHALSPPRPPPPLLAHLHSSSCASSSPIPFSPDRVVTRSVGGRGCSTHRRPCRRPPRRPRLVPAPRTRAHTDLWPSESFVASSRGVVARARRERARKTPRAPHRRELNRAATLVPRPPPVGSLPAGSDRARARTPTRPARPRLGPAPSRAACAATVARRAPHAHSSAAAAPACATAPPSCPGSPPRGWIAASTSRPADPRVWGALVGLGPSGEALADAARPEPSSSGSLAAPPISAARPLLPCGFVCYRRKIFVGGLSFATTDGAWSAGARRGDEVLVRPLRARLQRRAGSPAPQRPDATPCLSLPPRLHHVRAPLVRAQSRSRRSSSRTTARWSTPS